ncbi:Flp pilus assembly protein CpaB [Noviherbaspirillum agri]
MKNTRALVMIGVSVLVGLLAVLAAAQWVARQTSMATTKVVVAARDLDVGTPLAPNVLQVVDWPASSVLKGAFDDTKKLDARVLNTNVQRGEPLLETKLAPVGAKAGLSAVITEGRRAMTVKVNEVVGVAGFALPGNYVDIMVNAEDEQKKQVSKIVLEQILVLAVAQDQVVEGKAKVVSAVTLEVTPEQAEKLDLARSIGSLSLVLRNQVDRNPTVTAGARPADLLKVATAPVAVKVAAAPEPAPAAKPAPSPVRKVLRSAPSAKREPTHQVEVIRGVNRVNVESKNAESSNAE